MNKLELSTRIDTIVGLRKESSGVAFQKNYQDSFKRSSLDKAREIESQLRTHLELDLSRCAYLSIGGSNGVEAEYILKNTDINYAVLLEIDNGACNSAKERAKKLKKDLNKTLYVHCGDATSQIEYCRRSLLMPLRDQNKIDGLIVSIQSVLHELPYRSANFDQAYFLGEACWDWFPCLVYIRETCKPQNWPSAVRLKVDGLSSEKLELLANDIAAYLKFEKAVRSGPHYISLSADLAIETLTKIFYLEDYAYELQEKNTSVDPKRLLTELGIILGDHSVTQEFLASGSFQEQYKQYSVETTDLAGNKLPLPHSFVRFCAKKSNENVKPVSDERLEFPLDKIFDSKGIPEFNYVERLDGELDKRLVNAIKSRGTLVLLSGPGKSGKTSLYHSAARSLNFRPIKIRCYKGLDESNFWLKIYSIIDSACFERNLPKPRKPKVIDAGYAISFLKKHKYLVGPEKRF